MRFLRRLRELWQKIRSQCSSDPLERCRWIKFPAARHSRSEKPKDQLARAGEDAAADYLVAKGYAVLHRNIRFPEGELDIVARWERTLVFIEVKTRKTEEFGLPYEFVSAKKQRRQVAMASRFVSLCRLQGIAIRFDILSIILPSGELPKIEHIENAFLVKDL